jgi:hypothetical protein
VPVVRYPPVVALPFSLDEQGKPMPTYPCLRPGLGREVPVRFKGFRMEHLKHVGWEAYRVESYVNWCRHAQEVIPFPRLDGTVLFVPIIGEAP